MQAQTHMQHTHACRYTSKLVHSCLDSENALLVYPVSWCIWSVIAPLEYVHFELIAFPSVTICPLYPFYPTYPLPNPVFD